MQMTVTVLYCFRDLLQKWFEMKTIYKQIISYYKNVMVQPHCSLAPYNLVFLRRGGIGRPPYECFANLWSQVTRAHAISVYTCTSNTKMLGARGCLHVHTGTGP